MNNQNTQDIGIIHESNIEVSDILEQVYEALSEKGYNPVSQIVGYVMSGDPTYITSYKNARSLIMKADCQGCRFRKWKSDPEGKKHGSPSCTVVYFCFSTCQ